MTVDDVNKSSFSRVTPTFRNIKKYLTSPIQNSNWNLGFESIGATFYHPTYIIFQFTYPLFWTANTF